MAGAADLSLRTKSPAGGTPLAPSSPLLILHLSTPVGFLALPCHAKHTLRRSLSLQGFAVWECLYSAGALLCPCLDSTRQSWSRARPSYPRVQAPGAVSLLSSYCWLLEVRLALGSCARESFAFSGTDLDSYLISTITTAALVC